MKNKRRGIQGVFGQTIVIILLIIIILLVIMPIYVTVMYSLKTNSEYIKGVWALPKNPQWHYYTRFST